TARRKARWPRRVDAVRLRASFAMPHEEPRLEATLAGFDIRSPREGPSAGVTAQSATQQLRRLPALRLKGHENLVNRWGSERQPAFPRCDRATQGAQWGDQTSIDVTPPSAWRWRASFMTRKLGPAYC